MKLRLRFFGILFILVLQKTIFAILYSFLYTAHIFTITGRFGDKITSFTPLQIYRTPETPPHIIPHHSSTIRSWSLTTILTTRVSVADRTPWTSCFVHSFCEGVRVQRRLMRIRYMCFVLLWRYILAQQHIIYVQAPQYKNHSVAECWRIRGFICSSRELFASFTCIVKSNYQ